MLQKGRWIALLAAAALPYILFAQKGSQPIEPAGPPRSANSDGMYEALRQASPFGTPFEVNNFTFTRQGGEFTFRHGTVTFYAPVNGAITGAVFSGDGSFKLAPAEAREQHSLALLTKAGTMSVDFSSLVMRFSDNTAAELRKAGSPQDKRPDESAIKAAAELARNTQKKLHENLALRLLEDVEVPGEAGRPERFFFASFRMGNILTGRNVLFIVDPQGTPGAKPDQVELSTWDNEEADTWAAYRMVGADASRSNSHHVTAERLDVSFEKSGTLHGSAEVTIKAEHEDMRVARFQLFPTLRVSGVYDEAGQPLDFVQEAKTEDPQFGVILRQPARAGSTVRLLVKYAGPDALLHDGQGTYYLQPAAREQWYPSGNNGLGDFADFHMTFHLPKGLQIIATGKQLSTQSEPGGGTQAVWASETPISVAGFNLGAFHSKETRTPAGFEISAYASENLPDSFVNLANQGMGTLSTASALTYELAQGSAAVQIYSDYFGKLPYDHVALTQQSACSFGQSWPMLVYLPICAFWDKTVQHSFGLLDTDASYWDEVTPHEVSHQWWGQLIGFNSYRDQWMSEGFANYSVSVYLRKTSSKLDPYRSFWQEQLNNLTRKNENGLRPVDVGPLTMGYRVNNSKTGGFVAQRLLYSKGAYILHMLEMMYWTPGQGEQPFRNALQQFVQEYSGKAASTEDFKASLEKTMPKWLDLRGDGKLDWFFNEYVYGTEVPHYEVASGFTTEADGTTTAHLRVVQSGVSSDFVMLLPLYLQFQDGTVTRIANLRVSGDSTLVRSFHMSKLTSQPKRLLLNYNADVLSD